MARWSGSFIGALVVLSALGAAGCRKRVQETSPPERSADARGMLRPGIRLFEAEALLPGQKPSSDGDGWRQYERPLDGMQRIRLHYDESKVVDIVQYQLVSRLLCKPDVVRIYRLEDVPEQQEYVGEKLRETYRLQDKSAVTLTYGGPVDTCEIETISHLLSERLQGLLDR